MTSEDDLQMLRRRLKELQKELHKDPKLKLWPEKKIVEAIIKERELSPNQAIALQNTFNKIQAFKAPIEKLEGELDHRKIKTIFERLEKQLARLQSEIRKNARVIDHFLGDDLFKLLAPRVPLRSAAHIDGVPLSIILEIIRAFHQAAAKRVRFNKTNKGGKPRIWPRDLILEMIARDAPLIIGRRATSTINGPFEKLCESVLMNLKMSTDGLSEAIAEKLAEIRRRAEKEPHRGRRK